MDLHHIRNFCIIAHIDHGKSTLADRLLETTGTIPQRRMEEQVLDQMDLERERGITIKAQAVRMQYQAQDGQTYQLNLIDTPGHVDFSYEVSRSLAACEGAILVVDASQGIQAQTLAHAYLAVDMGLTLVPVVNKIDLPNAEPQRVAQEMSDVFGFLLEEMVFASAKEGKGVDQVLEAMVTRMPPPKGALDAPLRALVFDSKYDPYKGVVAYVRVVDGRAMPNARLRLMGSGRVLEALELGAFSPWMVPVEGLSAGEVGYLATGLKDVREFPVGDTVTDDAHPAQTALPGYRPVKPMVFAGLYPTEGGDYPLLREALEKLRLNDASLSFEPETSAALGFGFRCGFLGLLHMDVVQERLEREHNISLIVTVPSVAYQVVTQENQITTVDNPSKLPPVADIVEIREPWVGISIVTPQRYIGAVMELVTKRRGEYRRMEYLQAAAGADVATGARVVLEYDMPLSEILVDFYDRLKSLSQGYASLDYTLKDYRASKLVKLDILINNQPVDALSRIVHGDVAYNQGRALVEKLRHLIPRQLYEVAVQAAIGSHVIARETIRAMRKDVLAKCYGGDVTRKRKLLEKQAEGKKRLKRIGHVEVPQEAFMAVLKLED
ncbi:MAG: elongation factor 4 [Chloroflexi bacterium]|nr:elongation factor 4 [Chloroflexota bacterium]